MFAIAAHADEREAHVREVERSGRSLPEGSYGRGNRQVIAARETRIAARLSAIEQAYRMATERTTTYRRPEPTQTFRSPKFQADRAIDMEASHDPRDYGHPRNARRERRRWAASSTPKPLLGPRPAHA